MDKCSVDVCDRQKTSGSCYCSRHAAQVKKHGHITNVLPSYRDPNKIIIDEDVARILLLKKSGEFAGECLIDASDVDLVSKYKWHMTSHGYCATRGKNGSFYVHRLVLGCDEIVDHINMDKLDNRRSNLRKCVQSQNLANTGLRVNNTSGYKGVYLFKGGPKFCAQITKNRVVHTLGVFDTAEQASEAYIKKSAELFGEFSRCN